MAKKQYYGSKPSASILIHTYQLFQFLRMCGQSQGQLTSAKLWDIFMEARHHCSVFIFLVLAPAAPAAPAPPPSRAPLLLAASPVPPYYAPVASAPAVPRDVR